MFQLHPKTRRLVELFSTAPYGTEFTYAQVLQDTEVDLLVDRQRIYSVNRVLERDHGRTLVNMRGRGYKVARPGEFAEVMTLRKHRAGTQIQKAVQTGRAAPVHLLDEVELRTFADTQVALTRVVSALAYHDQRIARLEKVLGVSPDTEVIEGEAVEDAQAS